LDLRGPLSDEGKQSGKEKGKRRAGKNQKEPSKRKEENIPKEFLIMVLI